MVIVLSYLFVDKGVNERYSQNIRMGIVPILMF